MSGRRGAPPRHPSSGLGWGCLLAVLALVGGILAIVGAFTIRDPDSLAIPNILRVFGL